MSTTKPDSLSRLRAVNPVEAQPDLGRGAAAQQTLREILGSHAARPQLRRRRIRARLSRGGLGVGLAALVVGGGAAFAATDPFGWWSSANPDTARYAVNPAVHVRTPAAFQILCHSEAGGRQICSTRGSGQRYARVSSVQLPGPTDLFTRANLGKAIAHAQARHQISSAKAARFRADLARVPDSFFAEMRLAMRYQTMGDSVETMGSSRELVPPAGTPEFLVCEGAARALRCQDLNGDQNAPIGAGIYMAQPAKDWRPAPARRRDVLLPRGISFTRAESRLLFDLLAVGTTSSGGGGPTNSTRPVR